jgi:proteasome lid subunit RPN8/RPN11
MTISVPKAILNQIEAEARREQPLECCGLLGGRGNEVLSCYPLRNHSPDSETRYFAKPEDLFQAMRGMEAAGEELLAIYHSHPRGPSHPSPTDIELAYYPEAVYLIASFVQNWEIRAFRIIRQSVTEAVIHAV